MHLQIIYFFLKQSDSHKASAAEQMRTALFWVITQPRWERWVVPKLR